MFATEDAFDSASKEAWGTSGVYDGITDIDF